MLPVVSIAPLSTLALAVFRVALGAVVEWENSHGPIKAD